MLLHGVGTTGWTWTRQADALATDLRVLVPDLPGHGKRNALPWRSTS
ncbi:alpha/beta fold hydrolase [Nonomuraea aridisoli]|nr:alpha/beta fold hydrolase [Nonomuraea aridisoli]